MQHGGKMQLPRSIEIERARLIPLKVAPEVLSQDPGPYWSNAVLQRANRLAGIFHALLVVGIFSAVLTKGAPYTVFVDRIWNTDVTFYPGALNATCEGREYVELDPWLECLSLGFKEFKKDYEDIPLYQPKLNRLFSIPMWSLLATFSAVTSIMHLVLATEATFLFTILGRALYIGSKQDYEYFLDRKMQPFRWLEYSFTSAIMMLCIAALSRISEVWLLGFLFVANVYLNLTGGLVTELLAFYSSREACLLGTGFLNSLWYLLYACSWFTFALTWGVIFDAYFAIITPYLDLPETGHLWAELFDTVTGINFSLFALYFLFPAIHTLEVRGYISYRTGEIWYIGSSFVAKGALVVGLMVPAVLRDD